MRFSLSATANPDGTLSATLYCDGKVVAETDNAKDIKALNKWAKGKAADWRVNNLPAPTESLNYSHNFSL